MIDRTYRDDPYEYMSQEPCDYCPFEDTDKCNEDNCRCMTYGIPVVNKKEKDNE